MILGIAQVDDDNLSFSQGWSSETTKKAGAC